MALEEGVKGRSDQIKGAPERQMELNGGGGGNKKLK